MFGFLDRTQLAPALQAPPFDSAVKLKTEGGVVLATEDGKEIVTEPHA